MTEARAKPKFQGHGDYRNPQNILEDISQVYRVFQPVQHRVFSSAPGAHEISEGEIVFVDDGDSTRRIYTKLNGSLRYAALT